MPGSAGRVRSGDVKTTSVESAGFTIAFPARSGPIARTALGIENVATGVEIYYNYAVTPYFRVTPDLQVIEPGVNRANTVLILGVRAQVVF